MGNPGGRSGVGRMPSTGSLSYSLFSKVINPPQYYEHYWWSFHRLRYLVRVIKSRGVENGAEWRRLAGICQLVSRNKRGYLYREFSHLFSAASMSYLFGDWQPVYADEQGPELRHEHEHGHGHERTEQTAEQVTP